MKTLKLNALMVAVTLSYFVETLMCCDRAKNAERRADYRYCMRKLERAARINVR